MYFLFSGSFPLDSRPPAGPAGIGASEEKESALRAPVIREETQPPVRKKTPVLLIVGAAAGVGALVAFLVLGKPKPAHIQVNSTPSGAKVFLDGTDTGKTTNCLLEDVTVGNRNIRLVKDGYVDFSETVNAVAGQTVTVNAAMTKNTVAVTQPTATEAWVKGFTQAEIRWTVEGGKAGQGTTGAFSNTMSRTLDQQRRIARLIETERGAAAGRDSLTGVRGDADFGGPRAVSQDRSAARPTSLNVGHRPGGTSRPDDSGKSVPSGQPGIAAIPQAAQVLTPGGVETAAVVLAIAKVKIELYKGSVVAVTIAEEADNTGSFSWPVPDTLTDGDDYKIRVSCSTDAGVYGESPNFTISTASLIVTFPSDLSILGRGLPHPITWTSNLPSENVKIELFKGDALNAVIDDDTANDGSYEWTVPAGQSEGTDFAVKITTLKGDVSGASPEFIIAQTTVHFQRQWENFNRPGGVTHLIRIGRTDQEYRLAVSETGAGRITYIDLLDTKFPRSYSAFALNAPTGLYAHPTIDPSDFSVNYELIIADTGNNRILRVSDPLMERAIPGGQPIAVVGHNQRFFVLNRGLANVHVISEDLGALHGSHQLGGRPVDIALNEEHNRFYVADASGAGGVRAFSTAFAPVLNWTLDYEPAGIACSRAGFIFVSDRTNRRIVKYTHDGRQVAVFSHALASLVPGRLKTSAPSTLMVVFENSANPASGQVSGYSW